MRPRQLLLVPRTADLLAVHRTACICTTVGDIGVAGITWVCCTWSTCASILRGCIVILSMLFCAGLICRGCAVAAGNLEWSGGGCEARNGVTCRRNLHQATVIDICHLIWHPSTLKMSSVVLFSFLTDCSVIAAFLSRPSAIHQHLPFRAEKTMLSTLICDRTAKTNPRVAI